MRYATAHRICYVRNGGEAVTTLTFTKDKTFFLATVLLLGSMCHAAGQETRPEPPTDSSAQASPIVTAPKAPSTDDSAQASPIAPVRSGGGLALAPQTAIYVRLSEGIDSGKLRNGQTVHGKLSVALVLDGNTPPRSRHATTFPVLPAGTPALLTVVGTVPAGKINAVGEMSLQLMQLGNHSVDTEILTFRGKPGHKDLPDSAPAAGTDAGLPAGASLTFHVQPPPGAVGVLPQVSGAAPGSITGVASGTLPPPVAAGNQQPGKASGTGNIPSGRTPTQVTPATNTPGPAQNLGQTSTAPNQPSSPAGTSPASSTAPR